MLAFGSRREISKLGPVLLEKTTKPGEVGKRICFVRRRHIEAAFFVLVSCQRLLTHHVKAPFLSELLESCTHSRF